MGQPPFAGQHERYPSCAPYPDPDRSGCWRVPIVSRKHAGLEAIIDAADLPLAREPLLRGKRWNWSGGRADGGGASVCIPGVGSLPRLIMGVADDPERLVCHANGDRLDCRRANLMVRTRSEVASSRKRPAKWDRVGEPYLDPQRPGVAHVPICSEKHAGMEALIDATDLPLVAGKRWHWSPGSNGRGMRTGSVVLRMNGTPKPTLARIIVGVEDPEQLVSHVNGDRLDCRRANLLVRNRSQVKAATRKAIAKGGRPCSSRFKGVHWQPDGRKWSVTITAGGTTRQLGRFMSEIDAALAYDAAARELFGEHALLNFSDPADAERLRERLCAQQSPGDAAIDGDGALPPPGMVDLDGACQMFNIPLVTWSAWMGQGRMPLAGERCCAPDGTERTLYRVEDLNRAAEQVRQLAKPYPDPEGAARYRVPLRGFLCYREAIVDAESLPVVEGRNWQWQERADGIGAGAVVQSDRDGFGTPLARVVAGVTKAGFDTRVSHRNGDPLDCRLANIIVRTMQQQMFGNRKMGTVNGRKYTSKFKGVSWNKRDERWVANITLDRKMRRLGSFHDELAAAQAYDEAARELFGEHARLNFPDGIDAWLASDEQRRIDAQHADRAEAA